MTVSQVRVWEADVTIPTYGVGEPDRNPMFLEKRVYQGSSGKVYPYPVIDKIQDEKRPVTYRVVFLENEYLHIELLPELGGRVYRALDKTNNYDFIYYNRVIKPALVGLAGPWVSGGIEFNWPQHHRPNTFGPVEYTLGPHLGAGKTVWFSEIDRMYGTKMTMGFTLYPGKAYLEVSVQLYNGTPEPQTFLWWANPAVSVNVYTQSVFPPDVHAVFDHGRRDVSRFPIATGTYYKVDYAAGVDISRYQNIPVPTSYMVYRSDYDFLAGYDYAAGAGTLLLANHHIAPGKKQWTWGYADFGRAWDRNLTDQDGPYIELMAGVYTDNQPDFSWLRPYEEKSFTQYFLPYKDIGAIKNASLFAAINLSVDQAQNNATLQVYATSVYEQAVIELRGQTRVYLRTTQTISPLQNFADTVELPAQEVAENLVATVYDAQGNILVSYHPSPSKIEPLPAPATPLGSPEELLTNEALYLAGLHLEQYRHATFAPESYYLEGLKRDPRDSRIHIAYGTLLLRRGQFRASEAHFRAAITSLTRHNANPYEGEAFYQLGLSLKLQGRLDDSYAAFYKATWSAPWQDCAYFALAQIDCSRQLYSQALELVERSLTRNMRNYLARNLRTALLRLLQHFPEAEQSAEETLRLDVADFGASYERYLLYLARGEQERMQTSRDELLRKMRGEARNIISLATAYLHCGLYADAISALNLLVSSPDQTAYPMLHYYLAYACQLLGRSELAAAHRQAANSASSDYCFPNSLDDLLVLESALAAHPDDGMAHYYLGNLLYDKKRSTDAVRHWQAARETHGSFATIHRNLALAYYNVLGVQEAALASLEKAFACNRGDARVFYELDQLYKRLGVAPEQRLANLESQLTLVRQRDDLYLEYITLLNTLNRPHDALDLLSSHLFHPWEGGEGKVTAQYVFAQMELGKRLLRAGAYQEARETLQRALHYPENLGEGKLPGARENNVYYYLGCAYEGLGLQEQAREVFQLASQGLEEPASVMFYNDQPPDMIYYAGLAWLKLENPAEARRRFNKLISYGERHLFDHVTLDYFAVSLPDFLVFEDNLDRRNEIHCYFMLALGHLGLQELQQARDYFTHVLDLDHNHQGARMHLAAITTGSAL